MKVLWNKGTCYILAGVILQSFCTLRQSLFMPMLNVIPEEMLFLSNPSVFISIWIVVIFFSRVAGAYSLGKYAESEGFLKTQKILILGYILTSSLLFLCCSYIGDFYKIKQVVLLISMVNGFLLPASLMLPAMYLTRIYDASLHVKIGALMMICSVFGYGLSYFIFNFVVGCNIKTMGGIFLGASLLGWVAYNLYKKFIVNLVTIDAAKADSIPIKKGSQILPGYLAKSLAILIGSIYGAGMYFNYSFGEPYMLDVLMLKKHDLSLIYLLFFIETILSLAIVSKISDYVDRATLMVLSLVGMLLVMLAISVFHVSSVGIYIVCQGLFAFFFASFIAPSLGVIFSLFKNTQLIFNGVFWFPLGASFSLLVGHFFSRHLGPFHSCFSVVSPIVFNALFCLGIVVIIKICFFKKRSLSRVSRERGTVG